MDFPFWLWLVIVGIFFSAYMTIRTNKEEREMERKLAEKEGEVYLERIKKERERRKKLSSDTS
ncbi:sporulation YhaL family protein [Fervidibacillus halotolerans]|uniref:Sporulation YhaL family protein n=1 Tax=Fervidibacillus halotolerans TaxID=2980027 RepID=A0A9E8RZ73_9BACI|nr:sporulation YhaL family protein [Fervidibacillus halotolerans]WAA13008.1 sporulation YhaL family protein [Fervidibacillus halotolerans]